MKKIQFVSRILAIAAVCVFLVSGTVFASAEKKTVEAGDVITFGHYPQTAAGTDQTPIEWIVLDVQDGKALVISKYILDYQPYHADMTDKQATWETCTLRAWLNDEFLNTAFTPEEQETILVTEVDNSKAQSMSIGTKSTTGGNNTRDKVFVLSFAEAHNFLGVVIGKNPDAQAAPTAYACELGLQTREKYKTAEGKEAGRWWLRTHGYDRSSEDYIDFDGAIASSFSYWGWEGVRPVFWLNLDAD